MILAFENKDNLMDHKRQIIITAIEILSEFDEPLQCKFWDSFIGMAEDGLSRIDTGKNGSEYDTIFTRFEDIVGDLIYALAKIYDISKTDERKGILITLLLKAANSKAAEIRKSAAHGFRFLEELDLESQLTIFSLLFDIDDIAAQAVQSVARLSDKTWDETVFKKIVEKLAFHADSESLDVKMADAYALNKLLKRPDLSDVMREQIQQSIEKLSDDKFYRVRREASLAEVVQLGE